MKFDRLSDKDLETIFMLYHHVQLGMYFDSGEDLEVRTSQLIAKINRWQREKSTPKLRNPDQKTIYEYEN